MITVNFNSYQNYVTDSVYQWDIDQVLKIVGIELSTVPEVHFTNAGMSKAIVRQATVNNGVITVKIPNSILQDALPIKAYIGVYNGSTFKTIETVVIPVIPRNKPEDYDIEDADEEIYSFKALENAIANMATKADNSKTWAETEKLNARIDAIIGGNTIADGYETIELDSHIETNESTGVVTKQIDAYVLTNGYDAVLVMSNINHTWLADPGRRMFTLPEKLRPLVAYEYSIPVVKPALADSHAGCTVYFELTDTDTYVRVQQGSDTPTNVYGAGEFYFPFTLKNPYIVELNDLRVDIDGNTHGSAGEAVRKQISKLTKSIESAKKYSIESLRGGYIKPYCELGDISLNADTGEITYRTTSSRIRTEFLNLSVGTIISLSDYTNARYYLIKKKDSTFTLVSWLTDDYTITENAEYAIIISNVTEVELGDETDLSSLLSINIQGEYESLFENGDIIIRLIDLPNIAIDSEGIEKASNIRKTSDYILVSAGDIVMGTPGTISVFEWSLDDKNFITKTDGWATNYTVQNDCYIRVMINTSSSPGDVTIKRGNIVKGNKINLSYFYNNIINETKSYTDKNRTQAIELSNWRNNWFYDISHRGYMVEAPESTTASFIRAKLHGYNSVEGDIRLTSDGQFVIHHNDDMPSDSTYLISEHTLEELRTNANMGTYNGITQQILTFEEWIKLCKRLDMFVFIERKVDTTEEQISELIEIVKRNGMRDRVAWMSSPADGAIFRKYDSTCFLALLTTSVTSIEHLALETKPERTFIYVISTSITEELVSELENKNIGAVAWLVVYSWSMPDKTEDEIKTEIKRAIDCGIRGLCLDNWSVADILAEEYADYL